MSKKSKSKSVSSVHWSCAQLALLIQYEGLQKVTNLYNAVRKMQGKKPVQTNTIDRYASGKAGYGRGIPKHAKAWLRPIAAAKFSK